MNFSPILLLALLLCRLRLSLAAVAVTNHKVELKATEQSLGAAYALPKQYTASIECTVTGSSDLANAKVTWKRVNSNASLSDRFQVSNSVTDGKLVSVLTVKGLEAEDVANYSCSCCDQSASDGTGVGGFQSLPIPSVTVDGSSKTDVAVSPGDSIAVACDVGGNPTATLRWLKEADANFSLVGNATLAIDGVRYPEDRGVVTCEAVNSIGRNSFRLFLRVKQPNAFLLPLIILIVEICIVGVIVTAYEFCMRRKRLQAAKNQ